MLQFATNHVVNGSFYRDVNIKLEDHYIFFPPQRHQPKGLFFFFFGGAANT
jgi:hypothetical protein